MKGNTMENAIICAVVALLLAAGGFVIGWGTYHIAANGDPVMAGVCAGVNWPLAIAISIYNLRRGR